MPSFSKRGFLSAKLSSFSSKSDKLWQKEVNARTITNPIRNPCSILFNYDLRPSSLQVVASLNSSHFSRDFVFFSHLYIVLWAKWIIFLISENKQAVLKKIFPAILMYVRFNFRVNMTIALTVTRFPVSDRLGQYWNTPEWWSVCRWYC